MSTSFSGKSCDWSEIQFNLLYSSDSGVSGCFLIVWFQSYNSGLYLRSLLHPTFFELMFSWQLNVFYRVYLHMFSRVQNCKSSTVTTNNVIKLSLTEFGNYLEELIQDSYILSVFGHLSIFGVSTARIKSGI